MTDARTILACVNVPKEVTETHVRTVETILGSANADAIISALSAAGLVIVPVVPTKKMRYAAIDADNCVYGETAELVWRAMVEAASDE
jgi:hypothetical protein